MVIVTYLFRGNPLSPNRLLFSISSKGSFICTFRQTGPHILWWTSSGPLVGAENSPNWKYTCHEDSIRWSQPLQVSALPPELRLALASGGAANCIYHAKHKTTDVYVSSRTMSAILYRTLLTPQHFNTARSWTGHGGWIGRALVSRAGDRGFTR